MSFAGLVTGLVNRTQIYRALQGSYRLCALFSLLCAGTSVVAWPLRSGANHVGSRLNAQGITLSYPIVISSIKSLSIFKRTCHLQQGFRLHAIQIFKMSSPDTLQLENIIEDHPKDTLPHPADTPASLLQEDTRSEMPPQDRSAGHNVHIFDNGDRSTSIGGLILTAGITNANLYAMIEIFVVFKGEYSLQNESNITIEKDASLLLPGNYYIVSPRKFFI